MSTPDSKMSADLVILMLQRQAYIKQCDEQLPQTLYCLFSFINPSLCFTVLAQWHSKKKIHIKPLYNKLSKYELIENKHPTYFR